MEIDSLVLDFEGHVYVLSVNAYETLKRKCSYDWEAFNIYSNERRRAANLNVIVVSTIGGPGKEFIHSKLR